MATIQELGAAINGDLSKFGGLLRCEECGNVRELGLNSPGYFLSNGWPKHCGYTMRWWTQRQLDAGEMPPWV